MIGNKVGAITSSPSTRAVSSQPGSFGEGNIGRGGFIENGALASRGSWAQQTEECISSDMALDHPIRHHPLMTPERDVHILNAM